MTIVLIAIIFGALTALAFMTKRRFGVLGLSLAAGVVLSQNATNYVSDFYASNTIPVEPLTYNSAAAITLIILPPLILMFGGPKYSLRKTAVFGAVGFGLLATFFLIGPLTASLPPAQSSVRDALLLVSDWENIIVIVALVLALLDTFLVHGISKSHSKSSKHKT